MNDINPLDLQRLIDGECDDAEIRSLLTDAEGNPENWRAMASAFVEDQVWQKRFCSDTNPSGKSKTPTGAGSNSVEPNTAIPQPPVKVSESRQADESAPNDSGQTNLDVANRNQDFVDQANDHSAKHRASQIKNSPGLYNWLAVAAGLAIAGMVGYIAGSDRPTIPDFVPVANIPQVAPSANQQIAAAPTPPPQMTPAYHLQLPQDQTDASQAGLDGEVPLFLIQSREELDRFKKPNWQHIQMSPLLLKQLKIRGFQMNQNVEFVSGKHNDGRAFVVPVRTINFSPSQ